MTTDTTFTHITLNGQPLARDFVASREEEAALAAHAAVDAWYALTGDIFDDGGWYDYAYEQALATGLPAEVVAQRVIALMRG